MTAELMIAVFIIGFVGSFVSGMVGIGGSIIIYPLLLYVPAFLGFAAFTAHEVSGISAVQVFFSTLGGVLAFRKGGYLNKSLIVIMGVSTVIGSFIGGFGSKFLNGDAIQVTYAVLASVAAVLMFLPKKGVDEQSPDQVTFSKPLASASSLVVGIAAGIVGAAGAFILVPFMLVVLKIPTRMTIASSLAIAFISSIGATVGKVATGQVLFWPAVVLVIASVVASPLGATVSKRMNTKWLQSLLSVMILATAVKIWVDVFV